MEGLLFQRPVLEISNPATDQPEQRTLYFGEIERKWQLSPKPRLTVCQSVETTSTGLVLSSVATCTSAFREGSFALRMPHPRVCGVMRLICRQPSASAAQETGWVKVLDRGPSMAHKSKKKFSDK